MKLHLPTGLRKALLVCLAAVALPAATIPTTVASASGIAAIYLIVSEQTKADISGPEGVSYDNQVNYSNDVSITGNTEMTIGDEDVSENKLNVSATGSSLNLKVTAEQAGPYIINNGFTPFDSIWLSKGDYQIYSNDGQYFINQSLRSLYVAGDNARLTFKQYSSNEEGYFGEHKLAADFNIGRTSANIADNDVGRVFNLKLEAGITVETSGSLTIQDQFGYICLLNADGDKAAAKLSFDGAISGSTLRIDSGTRNNSQAAGTLYLGEGGELTGTLQLYDQASVVLGNDSTLKVSCFNSAWTSGVITTAGDDTATLEITQGNGDTAGRLDTGAGITVKMNAVGEGAKQVLTGNNPGGGEAISVLNGNVWVVAGTLELQGSDSDYTIGGSVRMDGGTLRFDKSTTVSKGIVYNAESSSAFAYNSGITVKGDWDVQQGSASAHLSFGTAIVLDGDLVLSNDAVVQFGSKGAAASTVKGRVTDAEGSYGEVWVENVGATFEDDVVLKGALRFGWGGVIDIKTKLEVGSLLLDNGDHSTTFGKVEGVEGDVYVVLNLSEEEGHMSKLGHQTSGPTIQDGTLTYEDNQFLGLFGTGVVFGVKGSGKKLTLQGGGTTQGGLFVDQGASLQLDGGAFVVTERVSGEGTLVIATADAAGGNVELKTGGSVGLMQMSEWGAKVTLGGDMETGGLMEGGARQTGRVRNIDSSDSETRRFTFTNAAERTIGEVEFGEHIHVVMNGTGTQKLLNTSIAGDLTVQQGTLELGYVNTSAAVRDEDSSVSGAITVSGGELKLGAGKTNGNLTLGATSVTVSGGKLTWGGNVLSLSGVLSTSESGLVELGFVSGMQLVLNGGIGDALHLSLTGISSTETFDGEGYDLFGDSWSNIRDSKDQITIDDLTIGGLSYRVIIHSDTGKLTLSASALGNSLEWNIGAGTWSENNFNNIEQQTAGKNVTFSSTGAETNVDITISGAVNAADIAVESGAKYTFKSGSLLTATGTLSIGSDAEVKVDMDMSVTGETTLDGVFEVAQHTYTFAERISGRASGVLKGFGGAGDLSSCILNLKKGGELSNLDVSWGATLNLGADLILHDWHFSDSSPNRFIKFAKDAEAAGEVNLVLDFAEIDKTITWHYRTTDFEKGSLAFDEVGLEKRGEGNLALKETEGGSNETHWEVQNLKVSAGTLKIDDSLFTVVGKLSGSAALELLANAGLVLTGGTGTETGFTGTIAMGSDTSISIGSGAKLKAGTLALGSNTGTIKLTVESNFADGFLDITSLTMDDSGTLKIVFTDWSEGWITEHSDGLTLFYGDGFSSWIGSLMDKITFWGGASGDVDLSSQVVLERNGKLVWTEQVEPGPNFTWSGAGEAVTLGDSISGDGWAAAGAVDDTKTVTLEGSAAAVTVAVDGGDDNVVTMKSLTVGNAGGSATTYTFSAQSAQTLKASEGITINSSAKFNTNVKLEANKLTISGQDTVVELSDAANLTGTLAFDGGSHTVSGEGGIEIGDGSTLKLTSEVFSDLAYAKGLGTVDIAIGGSPTGEWGNWFSCLFPAVAYDGAELTLRLSNNTNLKLNGNLGDRLQNAKKVDIENGSSVIVEAKDSGGQDLFNVGTGHELHIEGSGADGAGALVIGQAETISWAFVLDGAATVTNTAAMTLTGELDTGSDGKTLTKKGNGTLEFGDSFSTKAGSGGTVAVEEGTLKLSNTTNANALQNHTIVLTSGSTLESGITGTVKALTGTGTLNVTDGELTLTDATGSTLTSLQLAAGAKLTVSKGNFAITNALSWGEGSVLKLGVKLTIDLTGVSSLTAPEGAHKLKIDLASDALDQNNSYQLFSGWREDWNSADLFEFTINGQAVDTNTYADLRLNSEGKLEWGGSSPSLPEGADAFTEIVYSNTITNEAGQVVNGNTTVDVEEGHSVAAFTMTSGNLRVVAKGSADTSEFKVGKGEDIDMSNLDSVYFTGTGYFTDANCFNAHHPKTIYVKGAQLYFSAWGTGVLDTTEVDLGDTDFVIGTSTGGHAVMGYGDAGAALAFGKSVSTTGSLTVKDGDAAISLYSSGESVDFSVGEVRSENHTLTLRAYSDAKSRNVERSFTITSGGVIKKLISERDDDRVIKINLTTAGVLELKEGGKISGTLHGDGSAGLKVSSGELSVGVASGSLSALTLGSGARVSVGAGTLAATTLMLDGSCTLAISGEAKLDLGAVNSGANILEIDLTGLTWAGDNTYQLFTGNSLDYTGLVTGGHLTFTGYDEEYEVRLDNQGKLTLVSLAGGYIYDGSKDLIWDDSTSTNTGWQTDQAYENNASVQFTANEGTHAVKVGSDVVAGSLRVTGRAKYNVTSSADGAAHLLIVKNKMELVAGSELSFSKDVQLQLDGTASLAEGSKLAVSSNINLGDTGRFDGTGSIEKGVDVNQAYVQFRVNQGAPNVQKTVDAWVTEKLGGVTLGEGVGLQKTGEGILNFQDTGGTLNYDLDIAEGAVQFNGNNYTLKGKLIGQGNFNVATADKRYMLTMEKGGSISGDMALSGWGARLSLGDDFEVGGVAQLDPEHGGNEGSTKLQIGLDRYRTITGDGSLTVNVTGEATKEVDGLVIEQGVTLVKKGTGTQKFTTSEGTNEAGNGKTQLQGNVKVDEGVLEFEGAGSVISGALSNTGGSTGGTLKLTNGDLTISGGGKHGGALELTAGKITISGAALEVGAFKATEGELDVQSNLTIGNGSNEGLSTLKIASGKKVTLREGTLKADTLDLTGTQGASLSIDMTGKAKLDFGSIRLGADGKLAIELTGDNGDTERYQLFEESTFAGVWDALVTSGKKWEDVFKITVSGSDDKELNLNRDGWLDMETTGMKWNGGGTWSDASGSQWEGGTPPDGEDVRFTQQGAEESGTVRIEGEVTPRNVYVDGGEYTFTQEGTEGGGLNMSSDGGGGVLRVRSAKLTLELKNTSIPEIQLKDQGTLVLAHDEALPGGTKIKFQGGVLEYSDTKLENPDVSSQVAGVEGGSGAVVKVSVDGTTYTDGVTWGSTSAAVGGNSGLKLALDERGIEKSGAGDFTLAWQGGTGDTHEGGITVNEGSLTLNVSNATTLSGEVSGKGTLKITGGEVTLSGGNNTVTNIQVDSGATLKAGRANALGGAGTTLTLNGGNLSGNNVDVNAGQVKVMEAATLGGVTLTGTVTGGAAMNVESKTAGLSGDISGYTGELGTGIGGTWKLSGKALEQPVTNAVSGSGTVSFAGETVYSGDVKGSVTLEGGGENGEQLVITSQTTSDEARLRGQVTLGNQEEQAVWQGSALVNGEITLANVELAAGGIRDKRSAKLYVNTATSGETVAAAYEARAARRGAEVNVNGMSGEQLDGITINEHGQLTGITGSYTADENHKLDLHFAAENVGDSAAVGEGESALITGEGSGFSLNAESKENVGLWLSSDAVASIIGKLAEADSENGEMANVYLHLLQGGNLTIGEVTLSDLKGSDAELLEMLDVAEVKVEGENIRLAGTAADVYVVEETSTLTDTDAAVLGTLKSTVLSTPGVELTLNLDGETADDPENNRATVNNLLGVTGSQLHLRNSSQNDPTGANRLEVTFHNAKVNVNDKDKYPSVDDTTVEGQHTTFNGSIDGGEGVDVKKTGWGTLSVGGNYTLEDGTTTITAGALKLRGAKNTLKGLAFDYEVVQQQKDKGEDYRGLLLDGGRTSVRGSITEGEEKVGEIVMSSGAELVLNGESNLEGTSITGDGSTKLTLAVKGEQRASLKLGGGKNVARGEDGKRTVLSGVDVEVQEGASMEVSGVDAVMKGNDLTVQGGEVKLTEGATMTGGSATLRSSSMLDLGSSAQNALTALNGTGTLKSAAGGNTTITGEAGSSVFAGKLASSVEGAGAGKLTIGRNADVTLDNVDTSAAGGNTVNAWDVEVQDGGRLTLDVSKSKAGEQVVLGDVNFGSGNTVNLKVNSSDYNSKVSTIKGNTLSFGENTTVMLEAAAGNIRDGSNKDLTLGEWGAVKGGGEDIDVQLRGEGFIFADVKGVVVVNGETGTTVTVQLEEAKENKFERDMPNGEKNAMAGATMVWGSLNEYKSEPDLLTDVLTNSESDYARMVHGLFNQLDNGQTRSLQNALASVAGSSVATIGPAVMEDLHRQIKTIRNRTTTMATEATYDNYDRLPLWHAWINGEGGYHKMDADSQAPGYTLNNWGGTVGVDVDVSPQATMGLAITAMYGNLKPESVDAATGNVDMTYLSGFVRATSGAWIHTFVMSGGKADVQLDRTVNYGTGSYRTRGSTDGYVLGAMYEVGYTRLFSASGTFALQPVFNVEARHASIKGYTETGSDAGLHVDDISQDAITFGLGARMQSLVGENSFNRTAVFEARLLLKADVGDRSGTADNTLLGAATRAEVESVEVGAIGVEVGAGLTIPLGSSSGSIFMDASVECRRGWTSLDASAGYRISF